MRKLFATLFAAVLLPMTFAACGEKDKTAVEVYAPDGAPALALSMLMHENFTAEGYETRYNVVTAAQIKDKALVSDLAIVPSNMAAILFNSTEGTYKALSVNTFGNLFLVGKKDSTEIDSLADLAGKTVYLTGKDGAPDIVFQHLLSLAGVKDEVDLQYKGDGSEIIPLLKAGTADYAVLGEPAATQSTVAAQTVVLADLQEEWKSLTHSEQSYPQSCLIVKAEFAEDNPEYVNAFVEKVRATPAWLPEHAEDAGKAIQDNGSLLNVSLFTPAVLGRCNIDYLSASAAREMLEDYFEVIRSVNAKLIGGKLPGDGFYFSAE